MHQLAGRFINRFSVLLFLWLAGCLIVPGYKTYGAQDKAETQKSEKAKAAAAEQQAWDKIKNSIDPADYREYLKNFQKGAHSAEALITLKRLDPRPPAKAGATAQTEPPKTSTAEEKTDKADQTTDPVTKLFEAGNKSYQTGDFAAAAEQYRQAIALDNTRDRIYMSLSVALFDQGTAKYNSGKRDEAKALFQDSIDTARKAIRIKPEEPIYLEPLVNSLGMLSSRFGDRDAFDEMDRQYENLIQRYLKNRDYYRAASAYARYGDYLLMGEKPESFYEASHAYDNSFALNPDFPNAMIGRAVVLAADPDANMSSLEKASGMLNEAKNNAREGSPEAKRIDGYLSCLQTAISVLTQPDAEASAKSQTPETAEKTTVATNPEPTPTRRSEGIIKGNAIYLAQPVYPAINRTAWIGGKIEVEIIIDKSGKVIRAIAPSGQIVLRAIAIKAARESRFQPTLFSGQPVTVSGVLTYNFNLSKNR